MIHFPRPTKSVRPPTSADARAWWLAGDWDRLAPEITRIATAAAQRVFFRAADAGDMAADVAQEILVRCWEMEEAPIDPLAYVSRAARNRAFDRFKHSSIKRTQRGPGAEKRLLALADDRPDPLAVMEADERTVALRDAMRLLPEPLATALTLYYLDGYSVEESAREADTTAGAFKMRLVRSRTHLASLATGAGPLALHLQHARRLARRNRSLSL